MGSVSGECVKLLNPLSAFNINVTNLSFNDMKFAIELNTYGVGVDEEVAHHNVNVVLRMASMFCIGNRVEFVDWRQHKDFALHSIVYGALSGLPSNLN